MGIKPFHAEIIVREHLHRKLPETVHLIGRQTVWLTEDETLSMLAHHGLQPQTDTIELDHSTLGASRSGKPYISDVTFFRLLGVENIIAIDCSSYEGAEIIANLNFKVPDSLYRCANFIYGGSVMDNLFDPVTYISNLAQMLKSGGRLLDVNVGNFHNNPYALVSPAWVFDYFVSNHFADCKLYIEEETPNYLQVYGLEVSPEDVGISNFGSASLSNLNRLVVIAEKADYSTVDAFPNQDQYRSAEEWKGYRTHLRKMIAFPRAQEQFFQPTTRMVSASPVRRQKNLAYLGCYVQDGKNMLPFDSEQSSTDMILTSGIRIMEASYGMNVMRHELQRPSGIPLCRGNVTDRLASLVNGAESVQWTVNAGQLGDPAPGLPKALEVHYYFVQCPERLLRIVRLDAEANGKELIIPAINPASRNAL